MVLIFCHFLLISTETLQKNLFFAKRKNSSRRKIWYTTMKDNAFFVNSQKCGNDNRKKCVYNIVECVYSEFFRTVDRKSNENVFLFDAIGCSVSRIYTTQKAIRQFMGTHVIARSYRTEKAFVPAIVFFFDSFKIYIRLIAKWNGR